MRVHIQLMKYKKKDSNPGINQAIKQALSELAIAKCTSEIVIYIDGDPVHYRTVFLN